MLKLQMDLGTIATVANASSLLEAFLSTEDAEKSVRNVFTGDKITRGIVYAIGDMDYRSFPDSDDKTKTRHYASIELKNGNGIIYASMKSLLDVDGFLSQYATLNYRDIAKLLGSLKGLHVMFNNDNLRHVVPKNGGREFDAHNRDWQAVTKDGNPLTQDALNNFEPAKEVVAA